MLEPTRSPQQYYESSPALFWTVVAIPLRQQGQDTELLSKLKPLLEELLWKMLANNPTHLPHVQVMLLWTVWPLPNLRFWNDNTLLMINTAVSHAMQLGLNRPGFEADFTRMGFFVNDSVLQADPLKERKRVMAALRGHTSDNAPEVAEKVRQERTRTWVALVATYQR